MTKFNEIDLETWPRREKYYAMWDSLKIRDKKMYRYLRHHTYLRIFNYTSWRVKGFLTTKSYKFLCKHVKLGV